MDRKELILKDYAGQNCDVSIFRREDGSSYISFKMKYGYGNPSLDKNKLKELLKKMEEFEREA